MYWRLCEKCGAHLDPGEHCTCEEEAKSARENRENLYKQEAGSNQLTFNWPPERLKV